MFDEFQGITLEITEEGRMTCMRTSKLATCPPVHFIVPATSVLQKLMLAANP